MHYRVVGKADRPYIRRIQGLNKLTGLRGRAYLFKVLSPRRCDVTTVVTPGENSACGLLKARVWMRMCVYVFLNRRTLMNINEYFNFGFHYFHFHKHDEILYDILYVFGRL